MRLDFQLTVVCTVGYLDNILIYSDSLEDHRDHVCEVLHHLCMAGLYANLKKCKFHTDTVEYLGFILSPKGLQMDPTKVSTIQDWPEPWKVQDVQAFLGFANFYWRFIHDYSETTLPLNHLCKKSTTWHFGVEEATAFHNLKRSFRSTLVLAHWAPDLTMMVEMDTSNCAIVGILSVTTEDGEIWPVAFYSHMLQSAEQNYDTHNKELLAIYEAFKSWHHYLEGSAKTIDMVMDHKNLEYFTTTKKLTRWQARWSKFLSQFNLSIRFRPGRLGAKPDALMRRPDIYSESVATDCNRLPVLTPQQLERPHLAICLGTVEEAEQLLSEDLDHGTLVTDITRAAESDHLAQELQSKLETSDSPWGWEWSEGQLRFQGRLYVPNQEILHLQVICNHHNHPAAGHFGEARTSKLICHSFHWPGLRRMVKDYVASCATCACTKSPRHKPYRKLKQLPIPSQPWLSISMDFIEQLPASESFSTILVVVNHLMKQAIFIPSHDTMNALQVARLFLTHVFSKHRVLLHITLDCGSEFVSHFFCSLGKLLQMRLTFTLGYHLEGDGQMEHTNQVLEQYLQVYTNYQQDDWVMLLPMAKFTYNNATNAMTGVSPFFVNKGYHPEFTADPQVKTSLAKAEAFVAVLECIQAELNENITQAQERDWKNVDKHRAEATELNISD